MHFAEHLLRETRNPSAQGVWSSMRILGLLEGWWERLPRLAQVGLFVISILGMILGGSASGYWQ
jgi:hypothetical protein